VRLTQGCFSFLPDLTDQQIEKQVTYAISKGWAMNVEWTDDPHPRNNYWELWGLPLFDIKDPASVMFELQEARKACAAGYIRMNAFDASYGVESCVMSFIVNRPAIASPPPATASPASSANGSSFRWRPYQLIW
jgi:ribulose-bisphosphate carboxylase small chain